MSKWRTLRKTPTLEKAFEGLRQSDAHVGMGDVRLTIEAQDALCEVARNQLFNMSARCEQLLAFCEWVVAMKGGVLEKGKEKELVKKWTKLDAM